MPTSEARTARGRQRGFSYLLLLFGVAASAAALAAAAPRWQLAAERERERELAFRGNEIREALERYAAATAGDAPRRPKALAELLEDTRGDVPRHWLRRVYADPLTGQPDWQLLRDAEGGITGVASRSARRLHAAALPGATPLGALAGDAATDAPSGLVPATAPPDPVAGRRARDWAFVAAAVSLSTSPAEPPPRAPGDSSPPAPGDPSPPESRGPSSAAPGEPPSPAPEAPSSAAPRTPSPP